MIKNLGSALTEDLKEVCGSSKVVIVHGGGDKVTEIAEKLGKKQTFIKSPSGIVSRYTDRETVEIYAMVMAGMINSWLVSYLHKIGINAVGLSGIDGRLIEAYRKKRLIILDERGRRRIIDGGYTGKITNVNSSLLKLLLDNGYVPVISPVAIGSEYEILNVDSDRAAANIAGRLGAEKVLFLTDVDGLYIDGKLMSKLTLEEVKALRGKVGAGMDKKLLASIEALQNNVKEAIISNGFIDHPLIKSLSHEVGTVITNG